MIDKRAILVFTDWYYPGYRAGGPIRSLLNIVEQIDRPFFIITRITDYNSLVPYPGLETKVWTKISDRIQVMYVRDEDMSFSFVEERIKERPYHRFYLNSLFSPLFTILPLRAIKKHHFSKKTIVAPRGMLKSGALSVKSRKKKVFLVVAKLTGLYRNIIWHATSNTEAQEINQVFKNARVHIAEVLTALPDSKVSKIKKTSGKASFVSFSRISPEKGILEAIEFMLGIPNECSFGLDIYGAVGDEAYAERCRMLIAESGKDIRLMGEISPYQLSELYAQYHFFLLPTWGENFGHAISEALLHATPVIISNKTPWSRLADRKAGWDLHLKEADFVEVLKKAINMDQEEYSEWSTGAYEFGMERAVNPKVLEANRQLFA
ncbi:MAG: glycosyltransferase family 4 protein [Flavobacteriales bacterium]